MHDEPAAEARAAELKRAAAERADTAAARARQPEFLRRLAAVHAQVALRSGCCGCTGPGGPTPDNTGG